MSQDGFYWEAASIVEKVRAGQARIKSLCYASKHRNKKGLFAIVTEVCKNYDLLEQTLLNAKISLKGPLRKKQALPIVLTHDLVNNHKLDCSPATSEELLKNKTRIRAEYVKLMIKQPKKVVSRPFRYARVNTIICTVEECIKELTEELKFEQLEKSNERMTTSAKAGSDNSKIFSVDEHVSNLLVFPPGTDLTTTLLYKRGAIVLQDKASCMPVEVLGPLPAGAKVVDACAAPGNKTSQLAVSVGPNGKVIAFEKDPKRMKILEATLSKYTKGNVKAMNQDFLLTNPLDYADIDYCLVDPSCSGSGMFEEFEQQKGGDHAALDVERLRSLSSFQCKILCHAMKFPNVKRVVYSTCSVHKEENEEVVKQVLATMPEFCLLQNPLSCWPRRGLEEYPFASSVIRADPRLDLMNGFFVACFERKSLC